MVILALFAFSFSANAQMAAASRVANKMSVKGNIEGAENATITLTRAEDNKLFGTATAKKGKFTIESEGSYPAPFILKVGDKTLLVALQSGNISIEGEINNLQNATVSPSGSHKEYMNLLSIISKCKNENEKEIAMENYMKAHRQSWVSLFCLKELHKKHKEDTNKMRILLGYMNHFRGGPDYDKILRDVIEREEKLYN